MAINLLVWSAFCYYSEITGYFFFIRRNTYLKPCVLETIIQDLTHPIPLGL